MEPALELLFLYEQHAVSVIDAGFTFAEVHHVIGQITTSQRGYDVFSIQNPALSINLPVALRQVDVEPSRVRFQRRDPELAFQLLDSLANLFIAGSSGALSAGLGVYEE